MADLEETALRVGALLEETGYDYIVAIFAPDREFKTLANAKAFEFMALIDNMLHNLHVSPRQAFKDIEEHRRGHPEPGQGAPGQGNWRWN